MRTILPLVALMACVAGCGSDDHPVAPCTFSVSASSRSFGAVGGTGSVTVSAASQCSWTARAEASWLSIAGATSGSGQGVVNFAVGANSDAAPRNGNLIVAEQTVSIAQEGLAGCEYTVAPVEMSFCLSAMQGAINVSTMSGCPWTASTGASWITLLTSPAGGGSDTLRFTVSSNYLAPRESVIKIRWPTPTEGQNVRVSQAGCFYSVPTSSLSFGPSGGQGEFWVMTMTEPVECGGAWQDLCVWRAQANASWISIISYMPRRGDDPVQFTVAPNDRFTPRTGTIFVADKVVQIVQAGR